MATGVGRCRIWPASFNSPTPKTPIRRKHLRDISYTSRVIADLVPNFVAIATGVGRGRICLASFNSPPPKTPCYTQRSRGYLLYKPSYSRFCPKFRCHGNWGHLEANLDDAVNRPSAKTPPYNQKLRLYLAYNRSYDSLNVFKFPHRRHYKFFDFGVNRGRHYRILTPTNSILVFRPQMTVQSFIKFYSKLRP